MGKVENHLVFMRFQGVLDYFASLPVHRYSLILAMVAAFLLLSLPSLAITMVLGAWILDIPVHFDPLILMVAPLCAVSLSGIGALVGSRVRSPEEGGALNLVVTFVLTGLGPVIVPPDRLPRVLVLLGYLNPATYASSALRQVLIGPVSWQLLTDGIAMVAIGGVVFALTNRFMDWRER